MIRRRSITTGLWICTRSPLRDWRSAETMLRPDDRYLVGAVVAHTAGRRCWCWISSFDVAEDGQPTAGLYRLAGGEMARLADWLASADRPAGGVAGGDLRRQPRRLGWPAMLAPAQGCDLVGHRPPGATCSIESGSPSFSSALPPPSCRRCRATSICSRGCSPAFSTPPDGFDISLGLVGIMSFWLGVMKVGEKGGDRSCSAACWRRCLPACFHRFRLVIRPAAAW